MSEPKDPTVDPDETADLSAWNPWEHLKPDSPEELEYLKKHSGEYQPPREESR